jgi:hypothetical protein
VTATVTVTVTVTVAMWLFEKKLQLLGTNILERHGGSVSEVRWGLPAAGVSFQSERFRRLPLGHSHGHGGLVMEYSFEHC